MALTVKQPDRVDSNPIEPGVKIAVCYGLYDLGTQFDKKWEKETRKAVILWEIPEERIVINEKDLPRAISKRYTLSLHEKAQLRKDLEAWRGRTFTKEELDGFDLKNILGKTCQIQIIQEKKGDKTYSNISAIMALPKGIAALQPENELQYFSFEDCGDIPENTPKWISDLIKQSNEYKAIHGDVVDDETNSEPF